MYQGLSSSCARTPNGLKEQKVRKMTLYSWQLHYCTDTRFLIRSSCYDANSTNCTKLWFNRFRSLGSVWHKCRQPSYWQHLTSTTKWMRYRANTWDVHRHGRDRQVVSAAYRKANLITRAIVMRDRRRPFSNFLDPGTSNVSVPQFSGTHSCWKRMCFI